MLVAITGANGFMGSYLSNYLENFNYSVRRIQRNNNNNDDNAFLISDINEKTDWSRALENVDVIIHCAAKAHVFKNSKSTIESIYSFNVNATKNLAQQASNIGIKRFIFISTIKVFGEFTKPDSQFSLSSPLYPEDHYAKSKLQAELALRKIYSNKKMEVVIIRPPLIYGPGVKANFFKIMELIDKGYPLPFGIIKNKRSIIYLGNLADFILNCINHNKINGKIFLPSDTRALSTTELITKIGLSLNKKVYLIKIPRIILIIFSFLIGKKKVMNKLINSLNIDFNQSHNYMNWEPPFTTDEGLKKTAKWFKKNKTLTK